MELDAFTAEVRAAFEAIPPEFRERVNGPVVVPDVKRHKEIRGMVTLGECVHAPDPAGHGELWSTVYVYYGSFLDLARRDPSFDVEEEIVETVRHEVQHHVEDAVGHRGLRDLDWAEEQNARWKDGEDFQDLFWRAGERVPGEEDLRAVGGDLFLEVELPRSEWERARREGLEFTVRGERFDVEPGEIEEDEETFEFEGAGLAHHGAAAGDLVVVLRRRRGFFETSRRSAP
jgi:predicted Zn-dependent protease with MMP-like domain